MKAAVYQRYGPPEVIRVEEIERPTPGDQDILIRVHAASLNSADTRLRGADPFLVRLFFGFLRPRLGVLGTDVAGVVDTVGKDVSHFKPGDEVFGSTFESGMGAHAEYALLKSGSVVAHKPQNVTFEESAALFFGGHTALHFLRKGKLQKGEKVLVYGASGSVGTYAVQLAKYFGAEVHAVNSARNIDLAKSLGATRVFDYQTEDFSSCGEEYDIIFDTVGKSPFRKSLRSLKRDGRYLRAVHTSPGAVLAGIWTGLTSRKKVIGGVAHEKPEDLLYLKYLMENHDIRPVIDRTYPLEEMVEAHRYVEKRHKRGNVVIRIAG